MDRCVDCGHEEISYNSCRNRHCPKCQCLAQARWLAQRKARILPVPHFHVVFTLPARLSPVARRNPRLLYGLLFEAASRTLLELGRDPKWLGGLMGLTAVLHTWARDLSYHPHVHCVVTAGALSPDGERWLPSSSRYLFPVQVLSRLYRGKFMDGLKRAWSCGELDLGCDDPEVFARLRDALFGVEWVVYAKRPFGGAEQVYAYLGRYTHRVGISNHRLLHVDEREVRIATRDGKTATMEPLELIRRVLQHVLPPSFVKIRHYGLLASACVSGKLERARSAIAAPTERAEPLPADWRALMVRLTGRDLGRCPACDHGRMHTPVARRSPPARGPPEPSRPYQP